MNRVLLGLGALLFLQVALFVVSVPGHVLHVDEAWIGEQAWHTSREGAPRSELFLGHARLEERVVLGHWLTVRLGALAVSTRGWGLAQLRSITLVAAALLFLVLALTARRVHGFSWAATLAALAALALMPPMFRMAKIYRPEVLTALFGFASYACVMVATTKRSTAWAVGGGVLAGMAALAHLNGLLFVAAGWITLLVRLRTVSLIAFPAAAVVGFAPYVWEILRHWDLFRLQTDSPFLSNKLIHQSPPWINLLGEHKRLLRTPEIIAVTLAFLVSILPGFAERVRRRPAHFVYLGLVMIGLGCMEAKDVKYAVLLLPLFALDIGSTAHDLVRTGFFRTTARPEGRTAALAWLGLRARPIILLSFVAYALVYSVGQATAPRHDLAALHQPVGAALSPGTVVLAPTAFVFNEIERLRVVSLLAAREEAHGELTAERLLRFLDTRSVDTLILDQAWLDQVIDLETQWDHLQTRYRPRPRVNGFLIMDRVGEQPTNPSVP